MLRGEYGNLLEAKQQRMVEGEMLFIPARAANLPINNKYGDAVKPGVRTDLAWVIVLR